MIVENRGPLTDMDRLELMRTERTATAQALPAVEQAALAADAQREEAQRAWEATGPELVDAVAAYPDPDGGGLFAPADANGALAGEVLSERLERFRSLPVAAQRAARDRRDSAIASWQRARRDLEDASSRHMAAHNRLGALHARLVTLDGQIPQLEERVLRAAEAQRNESASLLERIRAKVAGKARGSLARDDTN